VILLEVREREVKSTVPVRDVGLDGLRVGEAKQGGGDLLACGEELEHLLLEEEGEVEPGEARGGEPLEESRIEDEVLLEGAGPFVFHLF